MLLWGGRLSMGRAMYIKSDARRVSAASAVSACLVMLAHFVSGLLCACCLRHSSAPSHAAAR